MCVWLPSHPGEEFTLCLTSGGKVSQWLVALSALDKNGTRKCKKDKKEKAALALCRVKNSDNAHVALTE